MIFGCQSAFLGSFSHFGGPMRKEQGIPMLWQRFWRQLFAFWSQECTFGSESAPRSEKWSREVKLSFLRPKRILVPSKAMISIGFLCVRRMGASWGVKVRFVMENSILERKSQIYAGFWCLGRLGALHRPQGYEFLRNYKGSGGGVAGAPQSTFITNMLPKG